jgi:hypothetical protein
MMIACIAMAAAGQQNTGVLKGKIENEKGKPLAKVEVRAMNSRDRSVAETYTDDAGKYSFNLEPGDYFVSFDAEGYQGGNLVRTQQVEAGKETEVKTLRLEKAKATSRIRGAVFSREGFGLAGARVKLQRVPTEDEEKDRKRVESLTRDYITNSRGEFAFRLPAARARYRITATLEGYKSDSKLVDVTESESVPLALTLEPVKKN